MASVCSVPSERMGEFAALPREFVEFSVMMKRKGLSEWKLPESHIHTSVELLYAVVTKAYDDSMECLIQQSQRANENLRFSRALAEVMDMQDWRIWGRLE